MKRRFTALVFFLIFNFFIKEVEAKKINFENYNSDIKEFKTKFFKNKTNNFPQIEYTNFIKFLAENIDKGLIGEKNLLNIEISSETQTAIDNIFTAEGEVYVKKGNLILRSEKLIYDTNSKVLLIKGNVTLNTEEQFLEASEIKYNLKEKKGIIFDAYGTLNFSTLGDITLEKEINNDQELYIEGEEEISNVILNQSSSIGFDGLKIEKEDTSNSSTATYPKLELDFNEMEKWRFKAREVLIEDNVWFSEKLFLTNDPFNKPQLIIENIGFKTINEEGEILIKTKWSSIILDDLVKIPTGPRRIKIDEQNNFKWGLGYDDQSKDGLFITRNLDPIIYKKDTKVNLQKEFFIQRILSGKTKSFSKKDESIYADKVEQDIKLLDFLGINADINSKFIGLDFESNISLNSLDLDKFKKAISAQSELSKTIYEEKKINEEKKTKISLFGTYREKVWNGSLGEKEILSAYGAKLEKNNNWIANDVFNSSSIAILYGDYESQTRLDSNQIINRNRLNLYLERNITYPIWTRNLKQSFIDKKVIYSPLIVPEGLNLIINSKLDFYRYEDNNYQNLFTIKGGPELTIGDFNRGFLDYTKISFLPKTVIASGNSPFAFDQSVDNHGIEFNIKQQLIGPLAIEFSTEYSLDINSPKYEEFFNTIYEISWNRRAYNLSAYYNSETKTGGLTFKINNFNFDGYGTKF